MVETTSYIISSATVAAWWDHKSIYRNYTYRSYTYKYYYYDKNYSISIYTRNY